MAEFQIAANPFGMMINPEAVIDAMNRSDRLERLQRRVYRPLDKPMIPRNGEASSDVEVEDSGSDLISAAPDGQGSGQQVVADDMSDVIAVSPRKLAY